MADNLVGLQQSCVLQRVKRTDLRVHNVACVLLDCKSLIRVDFIPLFVTHVRHPRFIRVDFIPFFATHVFSIK